MGGRQVRNAKRTRPKSSTITFVEYEYVDGSRISANAVKSPLLAEVPNTSTEPKARPIGSPKRLRHQRRKSLALSFKITAKDAYQQDTTIYSPPFVNDKTLQRSRIWSH